MRKEYDFSNAMPNPYIKKLQKRVSVKIDAPKKISSVLSVRCLKESL